MISAHLKYMGFFASQSGGFDRVVFWRKEMYNEIEKQRWLLERDDIEALKFLKRLETLDPLLYWKHEADNDGLLHHLVWVDGRCQLDYQVFGDVLAFNAMYDRNKYKCPLVVFSGINHRLQTIVFGSAIISYGIKPIYVWVLEKFVEALKGKSPKFVINNGDLFMRNAIKKVFPNMHHRLSGWHLLSVTPS